MSEGVHSEDAPVAVSGGPVTLTRTVERKSSGVTATYDLSTGEEAVGVRVRDDLPAGLGGDDVGFHPEFSPHVSEFDGDEVTFEAIVRPETSTTVVLGVVAADAGFETVPVIDAVVSVSPSTVEEGVSLFPDEGKSGFFGGLRQALGGNAPEAEHPTNEVVTDPGETPDEGNLIVEAEPSAESDDAPADASGVTVVPDEPADDADTEPGAENDVDAEADAGTEADTETEADAEAESDAEADVEADVDAEGEAGETTDTEAEADADTETDVNTDTEPGDIADRTEDEGGERSPSDGADAIERTDDADDAAAGAAAVADEAAVSSEDEGDGPDGEAVEPTSETEAPEGETAATAVGTDAGVEGDAPEADAETGGVDAEDSESVVSRLVAELEAGDVSDAEREALRDALIDGDADEAADADGTGDEADAGAGVASLGVRLDHLQSRVEQFGAYANALEDVIEDYGAADGFVRETEDSLEELEARVGSLQSEVASLEERDDLASTADLEDVEESLADLHADVVDDRESREQFEAQFDRRVSRVEDDLSALASDVREGQDDIRTDLRALRADVRELRSDVEEVAAMRENLAAALGGSPRDEDER